MIAVVQRTLMNYRIAPLARLAERTGSEVRVYCAALGRGLPRETIPPQVSICTLPRGKVRLHWRGKRYETPLLLGLGAALEKDRPTVVITEGTTNIVANIPLYRRARSLGIPVIWWDAGRRRDAPRHLARRAVDPWVRSLVRRSAACMAYGTVARKYLISLGVPAERIFIAQNTLDAVAAHHGSERAEIEAIRTHLSADGAPIVLYVGALETRKRVDVLLRACSRVIGQGRPLSLCLVGDGSARTRLEHLARGLLGDRCHFLGEKYVGIDSIFASSDLFVLPAEGGLALNQAMACGLPVIASSADGTEVDLIAEGENGSIVPEGDIEAMTVAILRILGDASLRRAMGNVSRQRAQDLFSLETMVEGMLAAVRYALGSPWRPASNRAAAQE
jgi:glycosyltransferase involved in cell wall biosynthesis